MPSPFPGMDPYLESWEWESFHHSFIGDISDALASMVRPKYVTRLEQRVYVEHKDDDDDRRQIVGDAVVLHPASDSTEAASMRGEESETTTIEVLLPIPEKHYETFLKVHDVETMEVVTIVELLSPANKRPGDGRREYLRKREDVLESDTHLVEIDLLRGGKRMPSDSELPPTDYLAIVSRSQTRPRAEAVTWSVRRPLPEIPIPLREEDAEVVLDLQPIFSKRYDLAGYEQTLDYSQTLNPPLSNADSIWAADLLAGRADS